MTNYSIVRGSDMLSRELSHQDARASLERLVKGNEQSVATLDPVRQQELCKGQKPFACVVSCADSRVVPEHIFSCKPGEIFVVRTAGNVPDIQSVVYSVAHLHVPLVVVLGHSCCGAIQAALKGERVKGIKTHPCGECGASVLTNALFQKKKILKHPLIADAVKQGKCTVLVAIYALETGVVSWVDDRGK